ncbi:MAG: AraC family transcriptional regulator [Prevotella sp.]|nr:AraC family transcriptional regulator [Prevotella sp.]
MTNRNYRNIVSLILFAVLALMGCTGNGGTQHEQWPTDTTYTQRAAMMVYDYDPVRALQIVDSAVIVGNLSEVWADVNRARIYSQSQMSERLDSMLGGAKGVRLDTAKAIGERLLMHDSLKNNIRMHQDVLEILVYTAWQQGDTTAWLQRSQQLVDVCRQQGAETEALRTEAEVGAALCRLGQKDKGMARLDSVIGALGSLDPFRFNELDAFIIASKRKIGVLSDQGQYVETLPLARRIIELLDDYEQHPDKYHDSTYREPANDVERADYIRFYHSQAQGFITAAYTALDSKGSMNEAYEKIERTMRDATAREHLARYRALEQKMLSERQQQEAEARAERNRIMAIAAVIVALLAVGLAIVVIRRKRIVSQKNRALVRQIDEAMKYKELYIQAQPQHTLNDDTGLPDAEADETDDAAIPADAPTRSLSTDLSSMSDAQLFQFFRETILRDELFLNPSFDRQQLMDAYHLSKDRIGAAFKQGSEFESLIDFLNDCRLDYSTTLLATRPDMTICEVAAASGFASLNTFGRNFKRKFTLTPSQYREQRQQMP